VVDLVLHSEGTADYIQMNPNRSVVPVDTSLDGFAAAMDDNYGGDQQQQQDQDLDRYDDSSEDGSVASRVPCGTFSKYIGLIP
jgi:hypothetical protein